MFASFSGVVSGAIGYVLGGFLYEKTWHIFNKDLARKMNQVSSSSRTSDADLQVSFVEKYRLFGPN